MFANQSSQSAVFAPKNESYRTPVIKACPVLSSSRIDADDPESALLQFVDGIDEVFRSHDRNIGGGACRSFNNRRRQRRRVPFGNDNAGRATGLGRSHDRTQIVRILDTIENDYQWLI